jgi:hypothetical protein
MLRLLFVEKSLTLHLRLFTFFCSAATGPYRSLTTDMLLFIEAQNNEWLSDEYPLLPQTVKGTVSKKTTRCPLLFNIT